MVEGSQPAAQSIFDLRFGSGLHGSVAMLAGCCFRLNLAKFQVRNSIPEFHVVDSCFSVFLSALFFFGCV